MPPCNIPLPRILTWPYASWWATSAQSNVVINNSMLLSIMASSVSGQDESNSALWLATRAGKMELSCPLGTTRCVPEEKFPRKPYSKFFIDQAYSVKMAGYWPCSFFASLWTETESRSINTQKKNEANIQPSWPHTWSITHTHSSPYIIVSSDYKPHPFPRPYCHTVELIPILFHYDMCCNCWS